MLLGFCCYVLSKCSHRKGPGYPEDTRSEQRRQTHHILEQSPVRQATGANDICFNKSTFPKFWSNAMCSVRLLAESQIPKVLLEGSDEAAYSSNQNSLYRTRYRGKVWSIVSPIVFLFHFHPGTFESSENYDSNGVPSLIYHIHIYILYIYSKRKPPSLHIWPYI